MCVCASNLCALRTVHVQLPNLYASRVVWVINFCLYIVLGILYTFTCDMFINMQVILLIIE